MKYIFLAPWKIQKSSLLFSYIEEFSNRLSKITPCEFIAPSAALDEKKTVEFYVKEIKKIPGEKPLCFALDENGKTFTSQQFAKILELQEINGEKIVLFCFGGAYGLPKEIIPLLNIKLISLSSLTFAHELAFAVALEQVYRARCIMTNHPYHHGDKSPLAREFNF